MNKLTLQFQDKNVAELYANHSEQQQLRFITHSIISSTSLMVRFVDLISNLDFIDNIDKIEYTTSVILLIYCFLSAVFIFKYRQYADQGLFLFSIVLAFNELEIQNKNYDTYRAYLFGSTQMIGHISVLIVMSFNAGIINTFLLTGIRIGITAIKSNIAVQDINFIHVLTLLFRKTEKIIVLINNQRQLNGNDFQAFYSKAPLFILIQYKQQIELILQKGQLEFQELLDQSYNSKNTLREYVYTKIDQFEKANVIFEDEEYLKAKINNQKEIIKFQYFQFYYMLSIESQDDFHTHIKQMNQHNFDNLLDYFLNILQKCSKLLEKNDKQIIILLKFTLHQLINFIIPQTFSKLSIYSNKSDNKYTYDVQTINLSKTIIKIINSIKNKTNIQIQFQGPSNIQIKSPKGLLNIFILELFKSVIAQKKTINISLYKNQYNILEISGFMSLPTNKLYLTLANVFILNSTQTTNCRLIIFNNEPDLSFLKMPLL